MHVSRRWLARHCAFLQNIDAAELARELSLSTCEVEGVQRFAPALSDVTIGFVAERAPHPDSDHLSLTKVDVGSGELLQIVCGAPNVAQGQKVAVATIGTTLPGDFKIKKSKIRGVESQGMICSERELGLGDEHNGIWVLPSDAQVGKRVAEALDLVDWVLEIDNKSLTHRPDLWGHRGIARELAAIYGKTLEPLASALPAQGNAKPYAVRVESEKCSRYLALPIDGVKTGRSPEWMRHLLLAVGQRPIELLVDLSNFVMLDLGQPNHLFDRARLRGEPIVVRQARAAERMQTLDGVERNLVTTDLLICAGENPVALAGVMGGEQSKVGAETRELLLEVASFDPACVRRTSSRLGLRTDASARFEKNLSPTLALEATGHLVNLLRELQPEIKLPAPLTDAGKWKDPARKISLRTDVVRRRLGVNVEQLSDAKIVEILQRLELRCEGRDGVLTVDIPSIRATKDLTIEQDLVEEVGRIFRYGNVPEARLEGSLAPPPPDAKRVLVRKLEDRLAGVGRFRQTLSYSFVADASLAKLGLSELPHSSVINPVAEGLTRIRRSVAPSLLAPLELNRRHSKDVRLFEIGKGYSPDGANEPREVHELALVIAREPSAANAKFDDNAFAFLRGAVDDVCFALRLEAPTYSKLERVDGAPYLHPGKTLAVRIGEREIGWLAALDPRVERELGLAGELKSDVALATLSLDALVATPTREKIYRSLPRFPGVKIDVALALPTGVAAEDVRVALERAGKGLARDIELFDVYTGPNAGPGRKSLAYHVYLESDERTLTDQDSQKFLQRVEREATTLGGELRKA